MKIKTLLVACLTLVSLGATAQKQQKVVDRVDQRTVQEYDHTDVTTSFKPYWYLDLQGGAQWTIGRTCSLPTYSWVWATSSLRSLVPVWPSTPGSQRVVSTTVRL